MTGATQALESPEPPRSHQHQALGRRACLHLGELSRAALGHCLSRASIYAAPLRYEPFGLSILEAAAAGCALVLSGIPSLLEAWNDAAWFVDPNDPEQLWFALRELIDDDAQREHLAARARQRAFSFGAGRMAAGYARAYTELLARGRDRSRELALGGVVSDA